MSAGSERLAADLGVDKLTGPARVLAEEIVRTKHRLDVIEDLLTGKQEWVDLLVRTPDTVAEIVLDKPVSEARQLALALATMLKTLAGMDAEQAQAPADVADEVTKRREKRLEQARASGS